MHSAASSAVLGGGEVAQVHILATAPHPPLVGLGLAGLVEVHAEVARLVFGLEQRQPLRLRATSEIANAAHGGLSSDNLGRRAQHASSDETALKVRSGTPARSRGRVLVS